ncbi:hypothetical protein FHS16_005935 [Paenibacillus endophyticus]|uniref:IS110 family transposase n=1 Tax=Paenibacillus endophyticus TaxID=1294268 RepID=A0A7W5CEL1_9BACL|nr:hypothetical protein [Paenibacillus endophyticus]MBB3155819.1 hypothetical protein [Paenibacillus endophyticus]
MKFKSQVRQNQLIEKITAQHLVVGIDIAQQTHVARAPLFPCAFMLPMSTTESPSLSYIYIQPGEIL